MRLGFGTVVGFALIAFGLSPAPPSSAGTFHVDWRVRDLYVTGAAGTGKLATAEVGQAVRVHCAWTAVISETGTMDKAFDWQGVISWQGKVKETRTFSAAYPATGKGGWKPGTKSKYSLPWKEAEVYGTATNEFDGSRSALWTPSAPGKHELGCEVAATGTYTGEKVGDRANNTKSISYTVVPSTVKPVQDAAWSTAPIITQPPEGVAVPASFKLVVKPRDPYDNCTKGGSIQIAKNEKLLSKPMIAACAPAGTTFDLSWPSGTYQVRARQFNEGTNFESAWSGWRTFTVLAVTGRGK